MTEEYKLTLAQVKEKLEASRDKIEYIRPCELCGRTDNHNH